MVNRIGCFLTVLVGFWLSGCGRQAEIDHYQVPHETRAPGSSSSPSSSPSRPAAAGAPQRMLAAIVPVDTQVWFFKAMGPTEQVESVSSGFQQLLGSVKFESPGKPSWSLPEGWTQQAGSQFRFATLVADGGLEVSVSSLPAPGGEASTQYLLSNINRWRNQLQLPPIDADQFDQAAESIEVAGHPAFKVDLTGVAPAGSGSMRGPFQSGSGGPSAVPHPPTSSGTSSNGKSGGLTYTKPDSWKAGKSGSFRLASFIAERDGKTAEITVIALGPAAGSVLDNVNRWRGQVSLPPIDQAKLDATISSLDVSGSPGQYIRISDPDADASDAILAVIAARPNQTLFIKMLGPDKLVMAEADAFEQFVRSIRLVSEK